MLQGYKHQVAGHGCEDDMTGPVVDGNGFFFKPLQDGARGMCEVRFYQQVIADASDAKDGPSKRPFKTSLAPLLRFLPQTYGICNLVVVEGREAATYLKMEDLTFNYMHPCIVDLKIGFRTWYKGCTEDKTRKYREKDHMTTRAELGFSISGMQVFDAVNQRMERWPKTRCCGITSRKQVLEIFHRFFSCNHSGVSVATEVLDGEHGILESLLSLTTWFSEQRLIHFSSSSVLIFFEGAINQGKQYSTPSGCTEPDHPEAYDITTEVSPNVRKARLCFIDFAHATSADGDLDTNVHSGLTSLMQVLREVLVSS
mmetsp:Transcript_11263/g.21313  ORF Transcript_11263/g.21313 Transcript_11263/m.21313 type:complete len:313 (+) Transcript_11263:154-1092(+)